MNKKELPPHKRILLVFQMWHCYYITTLVHGIHKSVPFCVYSATLLTKRWLEDQLVIIFEWDRLRNLSKSDFLLFWYSKQREEFHSFFKYNPETILATHPSPGTMRSPIRFQKYPDPKPSNPHAGLDHVPYSIPESYSRHSKDKNV